MSTLDEIAARDADVPWTAAVVGLSRWTDEASWQMAEDRRYLLGLVREAREALRSITVVADRRPAHRGKVVSHEIDAVHSPENECGYCRLLSRLTEGSDRT